MHNPRPDYAFVKLSPAMVMVLNGMCPDCERFDVGPPPTVRPLDDLSVRRAEREFLRS